MSVNPLEQLPQKNLDSKRVDRLLRVLQFKDDKLVGLRASQATVDGPAELELKYIQDKTGVLFEINPQVGTDMLACYYFSGIIRYIELESIQVIA